jgi:hypothetical protein
MGFASFQKQFTVSKTIHGFTEFGFFMNRESSEPVKNWQSSNARRLKSSQNVIFSSQGLSNEPWLRTSMMDIRSNMRPALIVVICRNGEGHDDDLADFLASGCGLYCLWISGRVRGTSRR